ncbi:DapH/DapD/GlmU-related protein [Frateuria sp. YIM B11624]|uniref:DapH/DapD/GlmU-related protein n=1 Tax=Frateuria sp. YIM B11624 TaxID=3143185 RepID=UPI003C741815
MAGWPESLEAMLERVAAEFRIARITRPELLRSARQTGFVWTRQPGVVCLAANRHYLSLARANPDVAVVVTSEEVARRDFEAATPCLIVCDRPDELYLWMHLHQQTPTGTASPQIDPTATVDASAVLHGDVRIEADAWIGPRVVISGPAVLGRGVHVEAGAIIGCDGLYAKDVAGRRRHIPHYGGVAIGADAFIHAGAVIVRSAIAGEATSIGPETHVGVMANVGHDVQVGARTTISSNVVIAGRARVGADVWIGASATLSNAVSVGDRAKIRIGSVVVRDVAAGADVSSGNFAIDHAQAMRAYTREATREKR